MLDKGKAKEMIERLDKPKVYLKNGSTQAFANIERDYIRELKRSQSKKLKPIEEKIMPNLQNRVKFAKEDFRIKKNIY